MPFSEIPIVKSTNRISPRDILLGKPVPKIDRLRSMNEDDFEYMVNEWASDYLKSKYNGKVKRFGGSGDKGRDVVGFYPDGKIDIYQCKHYAQPISPSVMWVEFGKLCYYTFNKDYLIPQNYYIVSSCGVGSKLQDYISKYSEINIGLIENWDTYCKKYITKTKKIELSGDFKKYVEQFDFSTIGCIEPLELIEQHAKTKYHAMRFGGGLTSTRLSIPKANEEVQERELKYIKSLYEVYSEELGESISESTDLNKLDEELFNHFKVQRDGFYSAESLERFSRDNFPESTPPPFDELKDEANTIVSNTLVKCRKFSGLDRLAYCISDVQQKEFSANALHSEITETDKCGLCHHLVKDGKINSWIKKST